MNCLKENFCTAYPFFDKNKWTKAIIDKVTKICRETDIDIGKIVYEYDDKTDKSEFVKHVLYAVLSNADNSIYRTTGCIELVEFVKVKDNKICWLFENAEASFIKCCRKKDCLQDINTNNPCVKYVFKQLGFNIKKYIKEEK